MTDSEIFPVVKKCIDRMDYYALLAGGAPNDEFDSESKEISKRIHFDLTAQELADIIAEVFNNSFSKLDDSVLFLPLAEQIMKDLLS